MCTLYVWWWLEGGMPICGRVYRTLWSDLSWQQLSVSVLPLFWQYISMSIFTGLSVFKGNDIGLHLNRVHVQYLYFEWTIHKFQYHSQKSKSQSIWMGKKYQVVGPYWFSNKKSANCPLVGGARKCEQTSVRVEMRTLYTVVSCPLRKQLIAFSLIINCRNVPLWSQMFTFCLSVRYKESYGLVWPD